MNSTHVNPTEQSRSSDRIVKTNPVQSDHVSDDDLYRGCASDGERLTRDQPRRSGLALLQYSNHERVDGLDYGRVHGHIEATHRAASQRVGGDRTACLQTTVGVVQ